ncbi:hypothetical protein DF3PB_600007 [uncultured Defluviicoccus sp.]|uniref:Uncharacterized protein n=1 Tax=metagenome TaxID=256318 RepID=A0A380TKI5_9ZZZZ|nr:hypothetical protein DF3PB_600007 [uncultured Defluviicoccus sp.]
MKTRKLELIPGLLIAGIVVALAYQPVSQSPLKPIRVEHGIEEGASIDSDLKPALDAFKFTIWRYGYKCDSVSGARRAIIGDGFVISCNHNSYSYDVEDRGGTWTATLR